MTNVVVKRALLTSLYSLTGRNKVIITPQEWTVTLN